MTSTIWDAAFQGDLEALREHARNGMDVNAWPPAWKSAYQPTALSYAVWGNKPAAVKLLLQLGADPNRPDGVSGSLYYWGKLIYSRHTYCSAGWQLLSSALGILQE